VYVLADPFASPSQSREPAKLIASQAMEAGRLRVEDKDTQLT
jgi:hypothetical protein